MFVGKKMDLGVENTPCTYESNSCMRTDLSQFSRDNRRRNKKTDTNERPLSISSIAMAEYKKRYSLSQYTLMLDVDLKKRWMDYCVRNKMSPSGLISHFITEHLTADEKKSA